MRIAVLGSCNIDLTFRVPRLPSTGETLVGDSCVLTFGGKGANQAVAAARLGAEVAMISCVGDDDFGRQVLANLHAEGIDTTHVRSASGQATGVAVILVDPQARNCIVAAPGANAAVDPEQVHAAADIIRSADVLLCQLEVRLTCVRAALEIARAAGVSTLFNPAPAFPLGDLPALADVCLPNEPELATLTGLPTDSLPEVEQAARALLQMGPGAVVVTLGERGALLVTPAGAEPIPTAPVQAVDPTGAGDAFVAALGVFLAQGLPLAAAARRAAIVAALTVTRPGAQPSFPSRAEADQFLATHLH